MSRSAAPAASHADAIAKGASVNLLGTIGKALFPAFFVVVTRLYSAELVGVYVLASSVLEVAVSLTVSGIYDGVLLYSARYVDDESKHDQLYQVLANGFALALGVSLVLVGLAYLGGVVLLGRYYPQPGAVEAIQTLAWSLPFIVINTLVMATTRAKLIMKWDALITAFLRPFVLLVVTVVLWAMGAGLDGMLWAWNIAHVVVAAAAVVVFTRYYSVRRFFSALLHLRLSWEMITFSVPQTLNMTFNRLIANMDLMMLAAFGYPAQAIGYFGIGSQIVKNIREVKLAFSGSYTPVIARYHAAGDLGSLSESFAMVTRWITSLALPIALAVTVLREDLLRVFHGSFEGDSTFMLWLLVPPLLSCGFGLAGNVVVATGHSGYNLLNSALIFGANYVFNYLLIPPYGIVGAAVASALASTLFSAAQLVEARYLAGARLAPALIYKPWLAILPGVGIVVLGAWLGLGDTLAMRVPLSLVGVLAYALTLAALGIPERDRPVLLPFLRPTKAPVAAPESAES
jgi:O-antigen/teichoic acid export membrane protein